LFRPIRASDATLKHHLFYAYSKDTVVYRYLGNIKSMPLRRVFPYVNVDYENEMTIVGAVREDGVENLIAVGSYMRIPDTKVAEVALVVRDDWQNRGLGTLLFNYLVEIAKSKGLTGFTAWVLAGNMRMMHVFKKSGYPMKYKVEDELYHITIDFEKQ